MRCNNVNSKNFHRVAASLSANSWERNEKFQLWKQMQVRRTVSYPSDALLARGYRAQPDSLIQQGTDWANKFFILRLSSGKRKPKWVTDPPDRPSAAFSFPPFILCLQANACWYKTRAAHELQLLVVFQLFLYAKTCTFTSGKTHIFAKYLLAYTHEQRCKHTLVHPRLSPARHTRNICHLLLSPSVCSEQGHMYSPEGLDLISLCSLSYRTPLHKRLHFCSTQHNPCSCAVCWSHGVLPCPCGVYVSAYARVCMHECFCVVLMLPSMHICMWSCVFCRTANIYCMNMSWIIASRLEHCDEMKGGLAGYCNWS